ncbi:hypothetical protein ACTGXZ_11210, partial [Streptococcus suis]
LAAHPPRHDGSPMPFEKLSDHFVLLMYEGIRAEVHADSLTGMRLLGDQARQRAEDLRQEIERRGLFCAPIAWPADDVLHPASS